MGVIGLLRGSCFVLRERGTGRILDSASCNLLVLVWEIGLLKHGAGRKDECEGLRWWWWWYGLPDYDAYIPFCCRISDGEMSEQPSKQR